MADDHHELFDAVAHVRRAARGHPRGENRALKAAGRLLLSRVVGIEWRVWPDDEPTAAALEARARDFVETARQLSMVEDDGDVTVYRTLKRLVREVGFDVDLNVPF